MDNIQGRFQSAMGEFSLNAEFQVPGNGITVIHGPSGSGKTTLLRCMAGLHRSKGFFAMGPYVWQDQKVFVPAHKRPVGFVFQEPNLFPHLTVKGNLLFGLHRSSKKAEDTFHTIVDLLGIGHLMDRRPGKLSGGEGQRVGLARALVLSPSLLLMDEPLSALDEERKLDILPYLEKIKTDLKTPIFYVTHSSREMFRLADSVISMEKGKTVYCGPFTQSLLRVPVPIRPEHQVSAVIDASVGQIDSEWVLVRLDFKGGHFWARQEEAVLGQKVRIRVLARDVSLNLQKPEKTSIQNVLPAQVDQVLKDQQPGLVLVRLIIGEEKIWASLTARAAYELAIQPGQMVWAQVKSVALLE